MNTPTKKVEKYIEDGMEIWINGILIVATYNEGYLYEGLTFNHKTQEYDTEIQLPYYTITYHKGIMPAYNREKFDTLQDLATAMSNIKDLRYWKKQKGEE